MGEVAVVEFDDYESLPTHELYVHMIAGAVAGVAEHTLMFPIDSVKVLKKVDVCRCKLCLVQNLKMTI